MADDELGEEYDEFRTTTGLKDDYDGIVTDAYFGKPQSGGDNLMSFLKVTADDGDEVELRYGLGKDWESYDAGKTVEHPRDKYFNNRTAWAEFFTAAMKVGAKEELGRRSATLERRGPRDSRLFLGMRFHFNVITEHMNLPVRDELGQPKRDERGQIITQVVDVPRTMPTKYLGTEADQAPKSRKSGTTRTAKPTPAAEASEPDVTAANGDAPPFGLEKAQYVKLKAKAKTMTHDAWMDWVTDQEEFVENDELVSTVGDADFYESLKGA
jgi:hypothetical protein